MTNTENTKKLLINQLRECVDSHSELRQYSDQGEWKEGFEKAYTQALELARGSKELFITLDSRSEAVLEEQNAKCLEEAKTQVTADTDAEAMSAEIFQKAGDKTREWYREHLLTILQHLEETSSLIQKMLLASAKAGGPSFYLNSELFGSVFNDRATIYAKDKADLLDVGTLSFFKEDKIREYLEPLAEALDPSKAFEAAYKLIHIDGNLSFILKRWLENVEEVLSIDEQGKILGVNVDIECPYCLESVSKRSRICRNCKKDIPDSDKNIVEYRASIENAKKELSGKVDKRIAPYIANNVQADIELDQIEGKWSSFIRSRPPVKAYIDEKTTAGVSRAKSVTKKKKAKDSGETLAGGGRNLEETSIDGLGIITLNCEKLGGFDGSISVSATKKLLIVEEGKVSDKKTQVSVCKTSPKESIDFALDPKACEFSLEIVDKSGKSQSQVFSFKTTEGKSCTIDFGFPDGAFVVVSSNGRNERYRRVTGGCSGMATALNWGDGMLAALRCFLVLTGIVLWGIFIYGVLCSIYPSKKFNVVTTL